jgi:hypothetical protein
MQDSNGKGLAAVGLLSVTYLVFVIFVSVGLHILGFLNWLSGGILVALVGPVFSFGVTYLLIANKK